MHTRLASRVDPPFSGKKASGSVWAHKARSCHSSSVRTSASSSTAVLVVMSTSSCTGASSTLGPLGSPPTVCDGSTLYVMEPCRHQWNYTCVVPVASSADVLLIVPLSPPRVRAPRGAGRMPRMRITALAGGVGGARFLRGLLHHLRTLPPDQS